VRLVVTGAAGGLGRSFLLQVPPHHQVHPFTHAELDVGDRDAVMQTIPLLRPDAIVHLAAFTKVDACETDPARATRDNALGAQHVALAARACGAAILHLSTDYVFDGMKGVPYDEMDAPHPLSVYGRTKLAGEGFVRHLVPEHFIVRTSYVYGAGDDYASGALERLGRGESAGGIRDRTGSPTFVRHLAARILPLLLTGRFGTYHLAGSEPACWLDVLERARTIGGLPGTVEPQEFASLGLVAPRPANSAMVSAYLEHIGIEPLPGLDEAVAEWIGSASARATADGSVEDAAKGPAKDPG
jgi:dTDP-4-dehydrorhamnose reductase